VPVADPSSHRSSVALRFRQRLLYYSKRRVKEVRRVKGMNSGSASGRRADSTIGPSGRKTRTGRRPFLTYFQHDKSLLAKNGAIEPGVKVLFLDSEIP
jgi:hypothetical protein